MSPATENPDHGPERDSNDPIKTAFIGREVVRALSDEIKLPPQKELGAVTVTERLVSPDAFLRASDRRVFAMARKLLIEAHARAYDEIHTLIGEKHPLDLPFFYLQNSLTTSTATPEKRAQAYEAVLANEVMGQHFWRKAGGREFLSTTGQDVR